MNTASVVVGSTTMSASVLSSRITIHLLGFLHTLPDQATTSGHYTSCRRRRLVLSPTSSAWLLSESDAIAASCCFADAVSICTKVTRIYIRIDHDR
jgi:hypothetical protein